MIKSSEGNLNICSKHKKQTFSGQKNIGGKRFTRQTGYINYYVVYSKTTLNQLLCSAGAYLTLVLLNLDISCLENSVDPDRLASDKARSHLILICSVFHKASDFTALIEFRQLEWLENRILMHLILSHDIWLDNIKNLRQYILWYTVEIVWLH